VSTLERRGKRRQIAEKEKNEPRMSQEITINVKVMEISSHTGLSQWWK